MTMTEKEKMLADYGLADIAAFRSFFEDYIAILNGYSDDVDVLKIKGYEEGETSYTVRMANVDPIVVTTAKFTPAFSAAPNTARLTFS